MTGLETAELLQTQETELPSSKWRIKIAPGAYPVNADDVIGRLKKAAHDSCPAESWNKSVQISCI